EDRDVLPDYYLSGGKRSRPLFVPDAVSRLKDLNDWAGWDVFDISCWEDPGPGEEMGSLNHELHLSRFWPHNMPSEVVGALWEERLPVPKRSGVYYTPRSIVNRSLSFTLDEFLSRNKAGELCLLDPACGSGYFLLEALRRLIAHDLEAHMQNRDLFAPVIKVDRTRSELDPARRMEIFRDHLFGVDLDPVALSLSRRSLLVEILSGIPAFKYSAPPCRPLFMNLREGDSILEQSMPQQVSLFDPDNPPPLKPFDWWSREQGFGDIMAAGGFNCIVGNPPWISLKGRHKQAPYPPQVVNFLVHRYRSDTYRPNVVEYFIRRSVELLAEGGVHSFVVPDRVAENSQYDSLRKLMSRQGEIQRLHYREPFPGVAADTLIYLFVKKKKPRQNYKILITDHQGAGREVPKNYWLKGEGFAPPEALPLPADAVLQKMDAAAKRRLSDFLETGVGFISRARKITREKVSEYQWPIIKGEHVFPYHRQGNAWFEFHLDNLAGGTRNLEKLQKPERLLLRKTGSRLIASRDESSHLPEQSLYFAFLRDRRLARPYDLCYFLGILNSKVMSFYFRHRKITNRATTPQIKKIHLDSLPIRTIAFNKPEDKSFHDQLVQAVRQREEAGESEEVRRLDIEIDRLVAGLYGLSQEDIELIDREMKKGWEAPLEEEGSQEKNPA
ncbi:MAG: TaqI-like C-terminal specificity domain-containing protein, partial [bacterium]